MEASRRVAGVGREGGREWGERANARHPVVTSVERGGAVDVSSDEGGLLFPHSVVPHPPDPTLRGGIKEHETKEVGDGEKKNRLRRE